ncbi:HAMP domain-containing sensor histidine kinase [Arundinibacter roseus]|uniref:histidine kinase n=1 Tax=Arundinibacter roseus TaxID=2070510 RepID=A0A4R4KJG3_9BACT|nr:HAMP domain-containing sensor histidine kinase [Arundinibacter roseus]TDB67006.1 HAMP domain-containing histidine kinase [Arundinibacter roseus]
MQIRSRLTIQFTLLVSGILFVSFVAIYYFTYIYTIEDFYSRLKSKAISTAELLLKVQQIDTELLRLFDRSNRDLIFNSNILIFDERNRLIYTNTDSAIIHISNYWLDEIRRSDQIFYKDGDYNVVGIYYKYPFNKAVVVMGAPDLYGKANLNNLRTLLIIIFVFITTIVAFAGWIFSKRALLPISKVMNEVEGMLPQKLDTRLEVPNQQDEIGRLTATFNKLLDRIENAFRIQKTFVANVSHELKNPLTKISSQLEVSLLNEREKEEYKSTIRSVLEDIKELSQLSNSLLELAKVSENQREMLTDRVRLDEILWDVRTNIGQANKAYKVQYLIHELPEDDTWLEIIGNPTLLKTAFFNLMENACKFSGDGSVVVQLFANKKSIIIEFIDSGKGISPEEQAMVFQPFYRGINTANVKGSGIGLSLVERIIKLHNGTIQIKDNIPHGSKFVLEFFHF